ncbi:hypothetical protein BGW38_006383 [Lunasporangiospora selenospora]|uniref:Uncharacterized protein n=1 Tax=Lunasporangiospora selenospora TaxID=979761 RepID=A0A9P6FML2_9FUNG|nr:hypothetical protein BGW38_006383 [Lunasporangiospora selenospora]
MTNHFRHWPVKVANMIVYLTLLSGSLYSAFGTDHDHGKDSPYDSEHQSYITPAPFTFFVWTAIYVLLGGMVIYQWFSEMVYEVTSWYFIAASVFNGVWLALWTSGHTALALAALFLVMGAVTMIYKRLRFDDGGISTEEDSKLDIIFLHLPFSLYHAWIFVLFVINAFAVLAPIRSDGEPPSTLQVVLSILGLIFVAMSAIGYIESRQGDVAGALVLAWYLFGAFAQQQVPAIHWTALGLGIGVAGYTLKPFVVRVLGGHSGEAAPLLG